MHIVFVTYEFVTEKINGGLGNYVANISSILAEKNHYVTVLLISNHNKRIKWKRNVTVETFKYTYYSQKNLFSEYVDFVFRCNFSNQYYRSDLINKKIEELDKIKKIDIVQYCGDDFSIWKRRKKIPSIVRLSSFKEWIEFALLSGSNMDDYSWLNSIQSRLFIKSLKFADAVYGPSKCVADLVRKKNPFQKISIIESPCLFTDKIVERVDDILFGKKYFLFFGKLDVLKGIEVIENAVYTIMKDNPDKYFVLMGRDAGGRIQNILDKAGKYKEKIIYMGEIRDRGRLSAVIKNAYACILPSRADNLPNTCIESMALGKIVIGTYGASFDQLIIDKQNGLLIKRDNPNELIAAIRYLNGLTEEQRNEMGQRAKKRVEMMSPDKIYNQVIKFYEDVIEQKKRKDKW